MKNDYLWDKTGPPDPEVERLEQLLGGMRFDRPFVPVEPHHHWKRFAPIAAALLVISSAVWLLRPLPDSGWKLDVVENGRSQNQRTLATGETLITGANSHAKVALASFAELEVEPNSRLRLIESRDGKARMSLDVGLVHALITAPAGKFAIATPSATAVDLGCAYTLQVSDDGSGIVHVDSGWVSFEWRGREVFIPAGAACKTRRGEGPAIPYFEDSSAQFRTAVERFDSSRSPADLDSLLASATKQDAFTLWHLLSRVAPEERSRIYDRLTALAPVPQLASRDAIQRLNGEAMDALWDSFGLDQTEEWRKWKRPWSQ